MLDQTQFLQRYDAQLIAQLTDPDGVVVDAVKVELALADAWATIQGYTAPLAARDVPSDSTLHAHQARLALGLLASNRAGEQFDSIRAGVERSIAFLERLGSRPELSRDDVAHEDGTHLYDDDALSRFGGDAA